MTVPVEAAKVFFFSFSFEIHTTTLMCHVKNPAAAQQWRTVVAKYANTKAQLQTKKACVCATCVVTSMCVEDVVIPIDLKRLHQHQVFEPKYPL